MENVPRLELKKCMKYLVANANLQTNGLDTAIPYVVGAPGIGKTRFLEAECKNLGYGFISFHFALLPLEDLSGLPLFKKIVFGDKEVNGTEWSLPDIMTQITEYSNKFKKVIIFLDDFHMCSPAHLALGYEMFSERKLRGYKFPNNTAFLLAGNNTSKSGAKQMFGAIINRFAIYTVEPEFNQWLMEYAIPNNVNPKIVAFLKNSVNRQFFIGEESTNEPWASPRSWSRFSLLLNAMEEYIKDIDLNDLLVNAYAHVGPMASSEFVAYYEIYSKIDVNSIFKRQTPITLPKSNSDRYIYAMALSNEYVTQIMDYKAEIAKGSKQEIKKNNAVDIISDSVIEIGKVAIEMAIAMLKNISDYETALSKDNTREKLYMNEIFKEIAIKSKEIDEKITKSISQILGSI